MPVAAKNNRSLGTREGKTNLVYTDIELLLLRVAARGKTGRAYDQYQASKNANHFRLGGKNLDRLFTTCL